VIKMITRGKAPFASLAFIRNAAWVGKIWVSVLMIVLALASFALGAYYALRPAWYARPDIREYNMGVVSYYTLPSALTQQADGTTPETHFVNALSSTTDQKLSSLAAYNVGTILSIEIGRSLGFVQMVQATSDISGQMQADNTGNSSDEGKAKIGQALNQLAEAIRTDPDNEDAKYNLELLLRMLPKSQTPDGTGNGGGFSPGSSARGY
jgi:hypothetical protein